MALGVKTGGRTKGTPNKVTQEKRERIRLVMSILEETQEQDIKSLTPKERTQLWADLQEYETPKLSRSEVHQEGSTEVVIRVIEDGTDSQET